jgi:hypothetical protein
MTSIYILSSGPPRVARTKGFILLSYKSFRRATRGGQDERIYMTSIYILSSGPPGMALMKRFTRKPINLSMLAAAEEGYAVGGASQVKLGS